MSARNKVIKAIKSQKQHVAYCEKLAKTRPESIHKLTYAKIALTALELVLETQCEDILIARFNKAIEGSEINHSF